mmetsp:Transcript_35682/g.44074  ORF Transcript_35682/g.44074 Transcript_35682/m.44074 type:complete len:244 (+) Transcript_35682:171-902(+)
MSKHEVSGGSNRLPSKKNKNGVILPETKEGWFNKECLFVVLEMASLETIKTKKGYQLLNSDDHYNILLKHNKDVKMYRPDIVHHSLLTLLDSPLNKAGKLKIFIHTQKNVLIDVNPKIRIPRTFKRFSGLMVQLLYQFRIRAIKSNEKLLNIIKNPITKHLPVNVPIINTSIKGELVDVNQYVDNLCDNNKGKPIVFIIGAHPHGPTIQNYANKTISISQYPLSSNAAVSRTINAFEKKWNIL